MQTTDTVTRRSPGPYAGSGPLVVAAVATSAIGVVLVVLGGLLSGSAAAYGAGVGTVVALGIFAFGGFAVHAVARLMPAASLLVAMVTYTFQVALLALVFVAISSAGLLEETLDRAWLGGAIVAGALAWTMAQLRAATTARIPAYDVPGDEPGDEQEGGAR